MTVVRDQAGGPSYGSCLTNEHLLMSLLAWRATH